MRRWWRRIQPAVFATVVYCVARLIGFTLRLKVVGEENLLSGARGRILAGWHGRTFLAALHFRNRDYWALISHSRDGEMQNRIFRRFGFQTIRGSTGRGGVRAAIECSRVLKRGEVFVFTPDGPRGPSQVVQRGILFLAQKGNADIIPAAASARPRKLFNSWDRYMIPYPFAKCLILIGSPISVPEEASEDQMEEIRQRCENELNRLQDEAERAMGYA
ncbi:MAG: hypothetical protein AKCLJLPJ_01997 [Fimbriimonadales bacterium]|nr:MAG: DUF374 domain-containing protein [Armatimonadota bacterium]MBV6503903.1 hypothetical protein [Fimbriimonadales bacterium]MCE7899557.1 DUF374 domain-containing protein [Armatimonadetes bacterium ATM1]MDL1927645.1 DUF374 domain-containing protein [Fimbriimonadia bacterium ATM]MBC6970263.1 DUF374 domain-containing protein [Armatimonadota bacterium]